MKWWFSIILLMVSVVPRNASASNDVSILLGAPTGPIVAGANTRVSVVFLNSGSTSITVDLPAHFPATLEFNNRSTSALLIREGDASSAAIAPGAFLRATYDLSIPASASGQLVARFDGLAAAPLLLAVQLPTTEPVVSDSNTSLASFPATAPATTGTEGVSGFTQSFFHNFKTYEPVYFIGGSHPATKFQLSFRYQLFDDDGSFAKAVPLITGIHFAYSQTSFWDVEAHGKPFVDNSYRPEIMFSYEDIKIPVEMNLLHTSQFGLQLAVQHESNGLAGDDSRSLNVIYLRPILTWEAKSESDNDFFVTIFPRVLTYIGSLSDNPDMKEYRGFGDLRATIGWRKGLQLSAVGRIGQDFNKGSLELDISQPLRKPINGDLDLYVYGQFFTGFGDELVNYNKETTSFRLGISLVR